MIKDANQLFTLSEELFDAVPTPKTRSFRFRMSTCHRTSARTFEAEKRDAQNERMVARDELGQSQAVEEGGENRLLEAVVSNGELGETLLYGEKENEHARLMEKSVAVTKESLPTANWLSKWALDRLNERTFVATKSPTWKEAREMGFSMTNSVQAEKVLRPRASDVSEDASLRAKDFTEMKDSSPMFRIFRCCGSACNSPSSPTLDANLRRLGE